MVTAGLRIRAKQGDNRRSQANGTPGREIRQTKTVSAEMDPAGRAQPGSDARNRRSGQWRNGNDHPTMLAAWRFTRANRAMVEMTQQWRSRGNAASIVLPVATAAAAIAIFVVDTLTDFEVAAAVLYVIVVLMAAR